MRTRALRLTLLGLLIPVVTLVASAQGPPLPKLLTPAPHADDFSGEPYVIQHSSSTWVEKGDGTGYREQTTVVKVQSDAALRQLGVLSIPFASASEHVEFRYVRVRRPDGSVLETPVTDALEEPAPVTREAPFYSDLKQKELPIKSLHVGDALEWQVRIVRTAAEAPGQFWGQDAFVNDGVVLDAEAELRVPVASAAIVWSNPKNASPPVIATEQGERVYRWKYTNLKPTVGPQAEAEKKAAEKHVLTADEETDMTEGKLPSIQWSTFQDWAAVGAWYRKLESSRTIADETVKAKVAELTVGKTTEEDKAHVLYDYVSSQIRYIGVSFGIGRFQPHSAADVLANQYGDCKDKHTLLASMLSVVGVSADAVLIGEGVRFNEAVPSPEAFNHLITRAKVNGQTVWLDTTTEVAPWRVLIADLRDKQALVIPNLEIAKVDRAPPDLPFKTFSLFAVVGSLDKDLTSDSEIKATYRGDDELGLRAVIHQVSPAQYGEFVQRLVTSMGFGGTTSQVEISNTADTSQPIAISFHYHRVKGEDWGLNRITATFPQTSIPYYTDDHPPVSTIQLGVQRTDTSTVLMKLPEHWGAELPEEVHASSPFATCDVTFSLEKSKDGQLLHGERRLVVLRSKILVSEWKAYKSWYDACGAGGVPYIQLTRPMGVTSGSVSGSGPAGPSAIPSNAEAERLIAEANTAEENRDPDKALELLDKAKALNPQQRNLWGTYGYRAYDLGAATEAIEDYRKELAFHPDQTWVYGPLSDELYRVGKKDEALETIRAGVATDAASVRLQGALVNSLTFLGDKQGAAAAGIAALKAVPADSPDLVKLELVVAKAEVDAGMAADAAALLTKVLNATDDTGIQNDAAYELSLTGLNLDVSEAAERKVLDALAAESSTWTLNQAPATLKQKSSLIFASWDTLGWILFLEGHVAEGRTYVQAAWRNRQDAEIGQHVGDIAMAEHDPLAALKAYELALATMPRVSKPTPAMEAQSKLLHEGMERAKKAGAKDAGGKGAEGKDARTELQSFRKLELLGKASGAAQYRVLIGGGRVEDVQALGTQVVEGGEMMLKGTSFAGFMPPEWKGKIVLTGTLICIAESCKFVVEP